jgi:outer membrane autotransporter protein
MVGAASGGISIVNAGTISGGLSGDGVTRANAVELFGSNNRFEIRAGSTSNGNVVVQAGGTNNVLALGGAANGSVNIGNIASTHTGFSAYEKTGSSNWALSGSGSQNWSIREGTLTGTTASMAGNLTFATGVGTRGVVFQGQGTYSGIISGDGSFALDGVAGSALTLANAQSYTGTTTITTGTLRMGAANALASSAGIYLIAGSWDLNGFNQSVRSLQGNSGTAVQLGSATLTVNNTANAAYSGEMSGSGGLTKSGGGSFTLTGTNGYTGTTAVDAGALIVNGSIAGSSGVTVAAGATLGGSGTIPTTVLNGGTLSPGNSAGTLTVNGNLTFNPGSTYLVEIQGANADRLNVTGTAALAGTLRLVPLGGAYSFNSAYTLLSAAGGRTGVFSPVDTAGTFGDGVTTTVSYTANDVLLTLAPKPLTPVLPSARPNLGVIAPRNAYAIAASIDIAVANGADPSSLFGIYNLPAAAIPAAVNSLSGEIHTAAPAMASLASDQFLRTMLDPTAAGRLGAGAAGPGAAAFSGLVRKGADEPAAPSRFDAPFYSIWGSAYGSHGRTDGNAAIGSAKRTIDDAHLATGIDIRLLPGTVVGVAVSGGKAQASLPGLIGKIDADIFQAGLYGLAQLGSVKLGGALSYARLENDINRSIPTLGSSLASSYTTTAWSGRLQASAALLNWNGISVSPLAAIQATQAHSPAVIEANWAGANAGALALRRRDDVSARSELGLQLDADTLFGGVPVTGYVRAAWAHYFRRDADLSASLIGLPGATFIATGAEAERNSALVSAGISARLGERVTLGLNLDSELSANSNRIGGSAQIRVSF